jgi:hypothetical protein
MTTREKHIAQKRKEILKIFRMQVRLILKSAKIISAPHKRPCTLTKRMVKVLKIAMQLRSLDIQKQIIISQPTPKNKFPSGASAIVGGYEDCQIGEMAHIPINWKT